MTATNNNELQEFFDLTKYGRFHEKRPSTDYLLGIAQQLADMPASKKFDILKPGATKSTGDNGDFLTDFLQSRPLWTPKNYAALCEIIKSVFVGLAPDEKLNLLKHRENDDLSTRVFASIIHKNDTALLSQTLEGLSVDDKICLLRLDSYDWHECLLGDVLEQNNPNMLTEAFKGLSIEQRIDVLEQSGCLEQLVKQNNPDLLKAAFEGMAADQRFALLTLDIDSSDKAIHYVAEKNNPALIDAAFEGMSTQQRIDLLTEERGYNRDALQTVFYSKNPVLLRKAFEGLTPDQKFNMLKTKIYADDEDVRPYIHVLVEQNSPKFIEIAFEDLSVDQRFKLLKLKNACEHSSTYIICSRDSDVYLPHRSYKFSRKDSELLRVAITGLSEKQIIDLLEQEGKYKETPVHAIARQNDNIREDHLWDSVSFLTTAFEKVTDPSKKAKILSHKNKDRISPLQVMLKGENVALFKSATKGLHPLVAYNALPSSNKGL